MNWWIYDRGDILTLMVNDYIVSVFMDRPDAELFAKEFKINIIKKQRRRK